MSVKLLIISDATGDTAKTLATAALRQFEEPDVVIEVHSQIRDEDAIETILEKNTNLRGLVLHSLVNIEHRTALKALCAELQIVEIDTIGSLMNHLAMTSNRRLFRCRVGNMR